MAYNVSERYKEVIYGGDYSHRLRLWFNNVEFENADAYCESLKIKRGILAEGSNNFSLNNFVTQSIELVLHDVDESAIISPIKISIGTLVDDIYEYVPIGIFNVSEKPTNDKNKITIQAKDNSIKFDFNYNAKPLMDLNNGSTTKFRIFEDICDKAGVITNIESFIGSSEIIGIYDNTISARKYISDLAEQSGSIATIDRDGRLIFININDLYTWDIPIDVVESYNYDIKYKISKIIYESGIIKYQNGDDSNDTLYIDSSNSYINENTLNNISSMVIGFEIDSLSTGKILGNPAIDGYDLIEIYDDGNKKTFKTLATHELTYKGNMIQEFNTTLDIKEVESNISLNSNKTFKKSIKTSIDAIEGKFEIVNEQIDDQNQKVAQVVQTVDELNSKISDIADITTSNESVYATVSLENINESEPIMIKIHPTVEHISYLYPSSALFPSDNLYLKSRTLRFFNTKTQEIFDWELPTDLWYYDENNYDELVFSYDSQTVYVNRNIGINEDMTTYILDASTTEEYQFPTISLTEGDYTVYLLGYSNAYLFVRMMASNIYTSQFATKVELNSSITQTKDTIRTEVSEQITGVNNEISSVRSNLTQTKNSILATVEEEVRGIDNQIDSINGSLELKVGRGENDQVVSMLNASANEINLTGNRLTIQAKNFKLNKDGTMTCENATVKGNIQSTSGNIGGWTINSQGLTNGKQFIRSDGASTLYTVADLLIIRNYIMDVPGFNMDGTILQHYDINNDGRVTSSDYVILKDLIGLDPDR